MLNWIEKNKSELDMIDDLGFIWGHIQKVKAINVNIEKKEIAKKQLMGKMKRIMNFIRQDLKDLKFKTVKNYFNFDQTMTIDLYGDYYKYWK